MIPKTIKGIGMTSARTQKRLIQRLRAQGIERLDVLHAIETTPRHCFIDEALAHRAYDDTALPIGFGQTISQPYIVALMTETLLNAGDGKALDKVLEIGTGSGYQAAVIAKLARHVYSTERIQPLIELAQQRLHDLQIHNVSLQHSDGYAGWPEHGPFDGILVTAAAPDMPKTLLDQLSPHGGRMVIPTGKSETQRLLLVVRQGDDFQQTDLCAVRFVPFLPGIE